MGNWWVAPADRPKALTKQTLKALRREQPRGLSRRQLLRNAIGTGATLWVLEILGGLIGFLWPNLSRGFGGTITLGDIDVVAGNPAVQGVSLRDGAPAYFSQARTYVQLIDPTRGFAEGTSTDGEGLNTNVRTLYQRCPHLGCKPNFCTTNYWFECPCHGSRYDRLGQKIQELGPAPRSLDRFAHTIAGGELTVDTSRINLGPLPIALGQPGLVPARSATGCI